MGYGVDGQFNDVVNIDYQSGSVTVGTSEQLAAANGSSNLENRQEMIIYNSSENRVWFGPTGVSTSTGIPLEPQGTVNIQVGENIEVYLIAEQAGNSVVVQELS